MTSITRKLCQRQVWMFCYGKICGPTIYLIVVQGARYITKVYYTVAQTYRTAFLAATKQLYEWYFLSVRHTFLTMSPSSYHHEIFSSYYQSQKWRPCKRSRSEVKFQGHTGKKIVNFDPNWAFPDCNSRLNSDMMMTWCTELDVA